MSKKKIIILFASIAFILAGMGFLISGQNQEDTKFQKSSDAYLDDLWKFYPTAATMAGYHKYDDRLENLSKKSLEKRREELDKYNQEFVAKIDKFKLSPETQIDHELIVDAIDREMLDHDSLVPWEYNPLFYNEILINSVRSLVSNESISMNKRLTSAEKRLGEFPRFLKRAKENLKTPPQLFTQVAIEQFSGIIKFYREELPQYYDQAPEIKSKIQATAAKAISALEEYHSFLQNELLPRSDGNFRLGDMAHRRLVRLNFKNSIPLEELIARAKADYKNIRREMFLVCIPFFKIMYPERNLEQLGTQYSEEQVWNSGIKGVLDKIEAEHVTREEFLDKIKTTVEELKAYFAENQMLEMPEVELPIEIMPAADRGQTYVRLIPPGAYEASTAYALQIAPLPESMAEDEVESYLEEYNNFMLPFWTVRKVFPGEFVPRFFSRKSQSVVRILFPNMPLIKGWPVYLEEKIVESGFGNWNLFLRLNQLKFRLRAVVDFLNDFNIHEGSMTKEQAIDYMMRGGFQTRAEAERKWVHIALNPCDAAYTYVGIQEIADMEKEYRKLKGISFDDKEFRSALLSYGPIPIRLLKQLILQQ